MNTVKKVLPKVLLFLFGMILMFGILYVKEKSQQQVTSELETTSDPVTTTIVYIAYMAEGNNTAMEEMGANDTTTSTQYSSLTNNTFEITSCSYSGADSDNQANVSVEFSITDGVTGETTKFEGWSFILERDDANSPWKIVTYGEG